MPKKKEQPVAHIQVTLVKSPIGSIEAHRASVRGLGIRRMHQTVEVKNTPENRGMINKVRHLVKCEG
ncbi:MAG: 50S ribosomal protein L30 [Proteobacteria bacterium]|nr:50S ribosomal protein L30 [Pseudomonadota bacterium]MDE3208717.1 50S ribosomal protein L30 [Pseudomonadota bacterium]